MPSETLPRHIPMKHEAPLARLSSLGLVALASLAACSGGGGSGGGRMYVTSCVLGCNSGAGGQDVNCGIVNTYVNQDLAFQFTQPVDLAHLKANKTAFKVINDATAATPPGEFLLDPADKRRVIWRPSLNFGPTGQPIFGLEDDGVYRIEIEGTSTSSPGPFIQSTEGKRNESRVQCVINTTLKINDPIPGAPQVSVFVEELDPIGGGTVTKEISQLTGPVATTSPITIVFDDIMNVATVVNPSNPTNAPWITVNTDPDGNLADPSDQFPVDGLWSYSVDKTLLTTTALFVPTGGLPSGRGGQRKIVVNVPPQCVDLVDNSVSNSGLRAFTPETLALGSITIPSGGEQFLDQGFLEPDVSGADWGESFSGRLLPGAGGGSGRLGSLTVGTGQTLTFNTSPKRASTYFDVTGSNTNGNFIVLGDPASPVQFFYKANPAGPYDIQRRNTTFASHVAAETVTFLNNFVAFDPITNPGELVIEQATYTQDGTRVIVTWDTPGTGGNGAFYVDDGNFSGPFTFPLGSSTITAGGVDSISFGGVGQMGEGQLLTNYDFTANPGGTPPPFTINNGLFEFTDILIESGATLVFEGSNPGRLLARGRFELEAGGLILGPGEDAPVHVSNAPLGQPGRAGGPGAGRGGAGADRPDDTGTTLEPIGGLENPYSGTLDGVAGQAVGGNSNSGSGAGTGGANYPSNFPTEFDMHGGIEMSDNSTNCICRQVGSPGAGGGFAVVGGDGTTMPTPPDALPDTLGGVGVPNGLTTSAAGVNNLGLGAPSVNATGPRALDPALGDLLGGSGGGGGGGAVEGTQTTALALPPAIQPDCVDPTTPSNTPITVYRSHSGAGGGGGGGAVQVQAGRDLVLSGTVDLTGGDGGSADVSTPGIDRASPGGGGSGGALLLQSGSVNIAPSNGLLQIGGGLGGTLFDNGLVMDIATGGAGSPGLVRAESIGATSLFFDEVVNATSPLDPAVPDHTNAADPNASVNWVSVDTWDAETERPGSFSAGQSCWYKPVGNFLFLDFVDDAPGMPGWDMDLIVDLGSGEQTVSYRNSSLTAYGGMSPEQFWGNQFSENGSPGAPVVVRFQGAQATSSVTSPCGIDLNGGQSPIDPTSLTQWVMHPAELDAFNPQPDAIRFVVLFDAKHPDFGQIKGVTNLRIEADPQ